MPLIAPASAWRGRDLCYTGAKFLPYSEPSLVNWSWPDPLSMVGFPATISKVWVPESWVMAGHSQFKNIMYRKGAQDAKRAKVFTKIIRELTVAAKTGLPDPAANPRLRAAVVAAREANMPKDTMERAIKRGAGGGDDTSFEEVRYEGYGPGGVALIIEALTDNRNRTAGEIRTALAKHGGNLGETNSVSFMFERKGVILYPAKAA